MDKRQAILLMFSGSPNTWTAEQIAQLETDTNINITMEDLLAYKAITENPIITGLNKAINKRIKMLHYDSFETRLQVLKMEIMPAVDVLETIQNNIYNLEGKK